MIYSEIKSPTLQKIENFCDAANDWSFGSNTPANPSVAVRAQRIVEQAERNGWATDAFLGDGGEILVTADRQTFHFEFIVELDGRLVLVREDDKGIDIERHEGVDSDAFARLLFPDSSWITSAYSIQKNIGKTPRADSLGWHFETRPVLKEYQFWNQPVASPKADQYAATFPSITRTDGNRLVFTGSSRWPNCQRLTYEIPLEQEGMNGATETFLVWMTKYARKSLNQTGSIMAGRTTEYASMEDVRVA